MKRLSAWIRVKLDFGWKAKVYCENFAGNDFCVISLNGVRYGLGRNWDEALEDARLNWPDCIA